MTAHAYSPLLTDFYQLTMAYGYWQLNMHEQEANFHWSFRNNPFQSHHTLNCGLQSLIDYLQQWRFNNDELDYLATLKNHANERIFPSKFLDYLSQLTFTCDLHAIPEGTLVFPNEPLLRIQGPLIQCQLLESPLLNIMNFQTLIATKASRIKQAAGADTVIEFGLRRAQGPDGALSASRAAYIGGCDATSNTLAGKLFDIPVRGTHAHSWIAAFESEPAAFDAYTSVLPNNAILLVDTYDTLQGIKNAIATGEKLRANGAELLAIRLDSGNLADLSKKARTLLDEAGFNNTSILASNSLDEHAIRDLKQQNAPISIWGVGTNLVTAYDHPALDGVYKLSALQTKQHTWENKLKISEQEAKISIPGRHQIRRFYKDGQCIADIIYDVDLGISETPEAFDHFIDLLQPVFNGGKLIQPSPSIHASRKNALCAIQQTVGSSHVIPKVSLEKKLADTKQQLLHKLRSLSNVAD